MKVLLLLLGINLVVSSACISQNLSGGRQDFEYDNLHGLSWQSNGSVVFVSETSIMLADSLKGEWKPVLETDFYERRFQALHQLRDGSLLAVGYRVAMRSSDGGRTWHEVTIDPKQRHSIHSIVPWDDEIFLVGDYGEIFYSGQRASDWLRAPVKKDIDSVWQNCFNCPLTFAAIDSLYAVAVGYQGSVVITEDRGRQWHHIKAIFGRTPQFEDERYTPGVSSVSLVGTKRLVGVGSFGVFTSDDEGRTWTPRFEHDSISFDDVLFLDSLRGYCVGERYKPRTEIEQGAIAMTTNGGTSWSEVKYDGPLLNGLTVDPRGNVIAYGLLGTVVEIDEGSARSLRGQSLGGVE